MILKFDIDVYVRDDVLVDTAEKHDNFVLWWDNLKHDQMDSENWEWKPQIKICSVGEGTEHLHNKKLAAVPCMEKQWTQLIWNYW